MPLTQSSTPLNGLVTYDTHLFEDSRGSFARLFCEQELRSILGTRRIVQINRSVTKRIGAIRGMHFQIAPHAEMKLIRCLKGRVFDVAVDIRRGSPTLLQWHGVELSEHADNAVVIPEGFAHGFQVLEENSELLYLHTAPHAPSSESGLRYDDPAIAIQWPLPPCELSSKDSSYPMATSAKFEGIDI